MSFATFDLYLESCIDAVNNKKFKQALDVWKKAVHTPKKPDDAETRLVENLDDIADKAKDAGKADYVLNAYESGFYELREIFPNCNGALYTAIRLSGFLKEMEKLEEAHEWINRALETAMETGWKDYPLEGVMLQELGDILIQKEKHEEAIEALKRGHALLLRHEGEKELRVTDCLAALGDCYRELGRLDEALEAHREALRLREEYHKEGDFVSLFYSYSMNSLILEEMNKPDDAIAILERAMETTKEFVPEDHVVMATYYSRLANLWQMKSDFEKAIDYLRRAIAIYDNYAIGEEREALVSRLEELTGEAPEET